MLERLIGEEHGREKSKKLAGGAAAVHDGVSAVPHDTGDADARQPFHRRGHDRPGTARLHGIAEDFPVLPVEPVQLIPLHAESLHDGAPLKAFLKDGGQGAGARLASPGGAPDTVGEAPDGQHRAGERHEGDGGQEPVHVEGDRGQRHHRSAVAGHRGHRAAERGPHQRDVAGDPGKQRTGRVPVEVGQGKPLQLFAQGRAQIANDPLADVFHQVHLAEVAQAATGEHDDHRQGHV